MTFSVFGSGGWVSLNTNCTHKNVIMKKLIKQIKCGNIALFLLRAQMFLVHMPNVLVIKKNNVNREPFKTIFLNND